MKYAWALALVAAAGLIMVVEPITAHAEKPFPGKLLAYLPILDKSNQDTCKLCHIQVKNPETGKVDPKWNPFGESLKKAKDDLKTKLDRKPTFEEMFESVKDADADGDGVSNIVELVAGTKPGDKDSKPTDDQITAAKKAIDEWAAKMKAKDGGDQPAPAPTPAPMPGGAAPEAK